MFGFYLNHFNESYPLYNALKSIRAAYPTNPVAIQDDGSGAGELALIQKMATQFGNVTILPSKTNKMGWEGFYLVLYELQNYKLCFTQRPDLTHIFKMDPDTVILGPTADAILSANPTADMIGKFCPVGFGVVNKPRTIVERAMIARGIDPAVWATAGFFGGGYFIKNNVALLTTMISGWNQLTAYINQDKAYEDQCVSALCLLAGGARAATSDLVFGSGADVPATTPTTFAVHPVKNDLARWNFPAVKAVLNGSHAEFATFKGTQS